jgi:hypothetical protein
MSAHAVMLGEKIKSELAKLRPEYENNPAHFCAIYLTVREWRYIADALALADTPDGPSDPP